MIQRILRAAGAVVLFVCLALLASSLPIEAKTYKLRYSDIGPPRGPRAQALMWWADELKKRSKGQLEINFFWSQSLVKGKDTLKAVGSGLAEMGSIIGIYTPAELPVWNFANIPFSIADQWVGMRTWHELRQTTPELRAETNKRNVKILFNNTTGPVQLLTTKRPVTKEADLKGMKIRATGGWTQLFEALGAVPVNIGFGELYQALERGTIDGTIDYTPFVKSYKHFEVANYVTETNMGQVLGYGGGINLKLFKGMPKDLQDILVKTSDEYMDVYAHYSIDDTIQSKKDLMAGINGKTVEFLRLAPGERESWEAKAKPQIEAWVTDMEKTGLDARKFVAKFEATRDKYRKQLQEKGYPWGKTN
jgi:TRAP-type transport system periplasmic protein